MPCVVAITCAIDDCRSVYASRQIVADLLGGQHELIDMHTKTMLPVECRAGAVLTFLLADSAPAVPADQPPSSSMITPGFNTSRLWVSSPAS